MNTNLIHKWLRDPKFAPDVEIFEDEVVETPLRHLQSSRRSAMQSNLEPGATLQLGLA